MDLSNENIIHIKNNGIEYLQFKKLLEFKKVIHCYTLSLNDVDFFSRNKQLDGNYEKICKALNIQKESIVKPKQNHTDCIKNVESAWQKIEFLENVDGLITNETKLNLMLTFADCTPIFLYDPVKKIIGNIHSGWRGTAKKIGQKAVCKMINDYGSLPEDIIVCIGPCIGKCHFEVDEDVKLIFEQTFSYLNKNDDIIEKNEIINGKQKYHIDTTLINRLILQEVGIKPENIIESKICTVCNSNYMHSYRAFGIEAGRNASIIGMEE